MQLNRKQSSQQAGNCTTGWAYKKEGYRRNFLARIKLLHRTRHAGYKCNEFPFRQIFVSSERASESPQAEETHGMLIGSYTPSLRCGAVRSTNKAQMKALSTSLARVIYYEFCIRRSASINSPDDARRESSADSYPELLASSPRIIRKRIECFTNPLSGGASEE